VPLEAYLPEICSYAQAQRHYQRAHSLYQQYLAAKKLADSAAEELRAVA